MMDDVKGFMTGAAIGVGIAIIIICTSKVVTGCENKQIKKDNTTIEKTNYSNDSIRIELKHIDKNKNEKIIEVKGHNNDRTYKLFKQLIAE